MSQTDETSQLLEKGREIKMDAMWEDPGCKRTTLIIVVGAAVVILFGLLLWGLMPSTDDDNSFDYLLFTQSWPYTSCFVLANSSSSCRLPQSNASFWTIHGIWPSNYDSFGPSFCDTSVNFDVSKLSSIQADLETWWPPINKNMTYTYFWTHEWEKHGTCALKINSLNTELAYFKMALDWIQKYNMRYILSKSGFNPNSQLMINITAMWQGVKNNLGKNPKFTCKYDKANTVYYIQEIAICFDKKMTLVDCIGADASLQKLLKSCPLTKPIVYPDSVPVKNQSL